jgi:hypothetical protein
MTDLAHATTLRIEVEAAVAFEFLADPLRLGRWSLGCFDTKPAELAGLYSGVSLYDGTRAWFRIDADPRRYIIDYHVGDTAEQVPRISARVIPGPVCGLGPGSCYVTLIAWRTARMDDDRWARLRSAHEAEIWLIKAHIEAAAK